jgi:SAM-dependent methyltransferase
MSATEAHYATLLAPLYSWLAGGLEHAFGQGLADLQPVLPDTGGSLAVDLGAGFGMHTVPLARLGWRVVAIDSSPHLLGELRRAAHGLDVTAHGGDLLAFADHLSGSDRPDLIVCMGDTLTHLASVEQVLDLARRVAAKLSERGRFVATWRDYSRLPTGTGRFIPVRADADRILTCFLEDRGDHVAVHDILHERDGSTWKTRVGCYPKLRLSSAALRDIFNAVGLHATVAPGPRGMLRLVADAAPRQAARLVDAGGQNE